MQKDVAILLRIGGATGRNILAGILKRIKDRDNCTIRIASDADDFQRLASSAAALIADSSASLDTIQTAIADNKPIVLLNDWRVKEHPTNLGHIRTDDGEIGFKAADYLLSLGKFRAFGYVPAHTDREWSVKRGRAFQLRLRRNGCECRMFDSSMSEDGALGAWLKDLPKPAAVFCAWDAVTADVAFAARKAKTFRNDHARMAHAKLAELEHCVIARHRFQILYRLSLAMCFKNSKRGPPLDYVNTIMYTLNYTFQGVIRHGCNYARPTIQDARPFGFVGKGH